MEGKFELLSETVPSMSAVVRHNDMNAMIKAKQWHHCHKNRA